MAKTVFIIHTSSVSMADLNRLFGEMAPGVTVRNIVDDSLLPEVLANGGVTPAVAKRLCQYAIQAEAAGASLIFNQCSSVGEVADMAAKMVKVPLVKIDERMAETACRTGSRIGVVATLPTTMGPTVRLIKRMAEKLGKKVTVTEELSAGAFEKLIAGDRKAHNDMVIASIRKLAEKVDVVVCAQGSMLALKPDLGETRVPVLMSPPLGVQHAAEVLATLP
ncbi:MAG: aspartate/glutamate racemase family protein [Dehalococcoidia bacterium]|jgi:aspartate/glutamate racemase|nr:aspartate/glutamate racemase family protein [Dehalococcoidia bacterium]